MRPSTDRRVVRTTPDQPIQAGGRPPSLIRSSLLAIGGGAAATLASWVAVHGLGSAEPAPTPPPAVKTQPAARPELPALYIDGIRVTDIAEARMAADPRSPDALRRAYQAIGDQRFEQYRGLRERAALAERTGQPYDGPSLEEVDRMEREGRIAW